MILERISRHYSTLTKSQRSLADHVMQSYQSVAFMTASRLAEVVGVNESTVIRFAQRLGYAGFPDMVADIQSLVRRDLEPGHDLGVGRQEEDSFYSALAAGVGLMQRCVSQLPTDLVRSAREILGEARRVVAIGEGRAAPLAVYLAETLCGVGVEAQSATADSLCLAAALSRADRDMLVVGVDLGGRCTRVARALEHARAQGAHTLALSDSALSPCAQMAEVVLCCAGGGALSRCGGGALVMVIDALVQSLDRSREADQTMDLERVQGFVLGCGSEQLDPARRRRTREPQKHNPYGAV